MALNITSLHSINLQFRRASSGTVSIFIAVATVIISLVFLQPSYLEFPMDDAYIHLVYAQHLANHGRLFFSSPDEIGVATSSLLWVLLLAGSYKLGLPVFFLSKFMGVASLAIVGVGTFTLLDSAWPRWRSLTAALLISLSGNMLWFSLNGMETTLFLALGVTAILLYRAGRWGWLGVVLGLLILTRPEGIALAAALGLLDILAHRRITHDLLLAATLAILISAPWFIYLQWRTGDFLPTSAGAKQFTFFVAIDYMVEQYHLPAFLGNMPFLFYPFLWIAYVLEFGLGGMSLPPPMLVVNRSSGIPTLSVSIWAIPAAMLMIWLIVQSIKRFLKKRLWNEWMSAPSTRAFLVLFLWVVLHNLIYMFLLPVPGTASRYGAVNYILLWIAITGGLGALNSKPRLQIAATIAVLFTALSNTVYWNTVYDANIEHMVNVRIAAADYVREQMPEDICAAFDIGALRFYGGRPIVEIAALIDTEANQWAKAGKVDEYLLRHDVTCLILPGRVGSLRDGAYDLSEILKLDNSPLFDLELVQIFEIDRERWLLGYLPTGNYQSSVAIYRLHYK